MNVIMIMVIVHNYALVHIQNVIGLYLQTINAMRDVTMIIVLDIHGKQIFVRDYHLTVITRMVQGVVIN